MVAASLASNCTCLISELVVSSASRESADECATLAMDSKPKANSLQPLNRVVMNRNILVNIARMMMYSCTGLVGDEVVMTPCYER